MTCSKNILLESEVFLVVEFLLIDAKSTVDVRLMSAFPLPLSDKRMRGTFCFLLEPSVKVFINENIMDLNVEGMFFFFVL